MISSYKKTLAASAIFALAQAAGSASAADNAKLSVEGKNQDMSAGTVTADKIVAGVNGWMVVHRTADGKKPGPVIAHAPLKAGVNTNVAAILTEPVKKGEKFMLMLHAEKGGNKTGIFEYTLGAKEDAPVKVDDKLVMVVIEAL